MGIFKYVKGWHILELDFVLCDPKRYKEDQQMKVIGRKNGANILSGLEIGPTV